MYLPDYHIHTNYTDGSGSVDEIAKYCSKLGLNQIAISEHVRTSLNYDFDKLNHEILEAKKKYSVTIYTAAEAKILPNGTLDISNQIRRQIDFLIGSVHSWPSEENNIYKPYELLCRSSCQIIGHPKFIDEKLVDMIINSDKILEINSRYRLNSNQYMIVKEFPRLKVSFGSDAHNLNDIENGQQFFHSFVGNIINKNQIWTYDKNT